MLVKPGVVTPTVGSVYGTAVMVVALSKNVINCPVVASVAPLGIMISTPMILNLLPAAGVQSVVDADKETFTELWIPVPLPETTRIRSQVPFPL